MPARLDYDQIAAWIHGNYQKAHPESVYEEFSKLPEFLKVDNRDAAIRMGRVLAMAGLRLEPRERGDWTEADRVTIREIIEESLHVLAEAEHDGWVESRLRNGWTLGDHKDVNRREHHLLVRYDQFSERIARKQSKAGATTNEAGAPMSIEEEVEREKDRDRDSVRRYVDIIARTDYRIVPEL